jgi:hypothetical protein
MSGEKQDDRCRAPIMGFFLRLRLSHRQRLTRRKGNGNLGSTKLTCVIAVAFFLAALVTPSVLHSENDRVEPALKRLKNKHAYMRENAAAELGLLKDPRHDSRVLPHLRWQQWAPWRRSR